VPKNEIQCKKKKYNANFTDYLGVLIGLTYETITKIANKIHAAISSRNNTKKNIQKFSVRSDCIIFSCTVYY
jgi:hypothetical protein